jgi:hypothetical protein
MGQTLLTETPTRGSVGGPSSANTREARAIERIAAQRAQLELATELNGVAQLYILFCARLAELATGLPTFLIETRLRALGFSGSAVNDAKERLRFLGLLQPPNSSVVRYRLTKLGHEYARDLRSQIAKEEEKGLLLLDMWSSLEVALVKRSRDRDACGFGMEGVLGAVPRWWHHAGHFPEEFRSRGAGRRSTLAASLASEAECERVWPRRGAQYVEDAEDADSLHGEREYGSGAQAVLPSSAPTCDSWAGLRGLVRHGPRPHLTREPREMEERLRETAREVLRAGALSASQSLLAPLWDEHGLVRSPGLSLIMHASEGEAKRLHAAVRAFDREYSSVYVTCSPAVSRSFMCELQAELRAKVVRGRESDAITILEIEDWREINAVHRMVAEFTHEFDQVDVLLSGIPREAVFRLFRALNGSSIRPAQRWLYNEGRSTVDRTARPRVTTTMGRPDTRGPTFVAYEPTSVRLRTLAATEAIAGKAVVLAVDGRENGPSRLNLGSAPYLGAQPASLTVSPVDPTSFYDVFHKLNYYRPGTIILTGSRVVALACAAYSLAREQSGQEPPYVVATHVAARGYSSRAVGPLGAVLKVEPPAAATQWR